jgi:hypothetical protein
MAAGTPHSVNGLYRPDVSFAILDRLTFTSTEQNDKKNGEIHPISADTMRFRAEKRRCCKSDTLEEIVVGRWKCATARDP